MEPIEFHSRIVLACKAKNISVRQLEKNCGLYEGTIKTWKKSVPAAITVAKLATQLDVSLDYLFLLTNNPDSHKQNILSEPTLKIVRTAERLKISEAIADVIVGIIELLKKNGL